MGNEIPLQLAQFFRSILLGCSLALVYDIAHALRPLGKRTWGILLDTIVSIGSVFALFLLIMAEEGELRLFILLGTMGGAVLFFSLVSPALRPILSFWVELFLIPLRLCRKILECAVKFVKKVFSFLKKQVTMLYTKKLHWGEREHDAQKAQGQTAEDRSQ